MAAPGAIDVLKAYSLAANAKIPDAKLDEAMGNVAAGPRRVVLTFPAAVDAGNLRAFCNALKGCVEGFVIWATKELTGVDISVAGGLPVGVKVVEDSVDAGDTVIVVRGDVREVQAVVTAGVAGAAATVGTFTDLYTMGVVYSMLAAQPPVRPSKVKVVWERLGRQADGGFGVDKFTANLTGARAADMAAINALVEQALVPVVSTAATQRAGAPDDPIGTELRQPIATDLVLLSHLCQPTPNQRQDPMQGIQGLVAMQAVQYARK